MTIMSLLTILFLGWVAWSRLPLEFDVPGIEFPVVRCWIPYPGGVSPAEVEKAVAEPAEGVFRTISKLRSVSCHASGGGCYILLTFDWDTDMGFATAEVRDRIERLKANLPQECSRYLISRSLTSEFSTIRVVLFSKKPRTELSYLVRTRIRPRLLCLPGVARLDVDNAEEESIYIEFNQDVLKSLNLSLAGIMENLRACNLNVTAGELNEDVKEYGVRVNNEMRSLEQIGNLTVGANGLRLKQIADVRLRGPSTDVKFTMDGAPGVFVSIIKEPEASTVPVCDAVRRELAEMRSDPALADIETFVYEDKGAMIRTSVGTLYEISKMSAWLTFGVLLLFLRRLLPALLIWMSIPASLVASVILLYFRGMTLNMATLTSMVVALGMVVDNSIVVLDSIRRYQHMGYSHFESSSRGAGDVAIAITAATLTTVVVFLPVGFAPTGEISIHLRVFALPMAAALVMSLVIALTLVPLALTIMPVEHHRGWAERFYAGTARMFRVEAVKGVGVTLYGGALRWVCTHPAASFAGTLTLLAATYLFAFQGVGEQQIPPPDWRRIAIDVSFESGFGGERAIRAFNMLEDIINGKRQELGIRNVYVSCGPWGGSFRIYLNDLHSRAPGRPAPLPTDEVKKRLRELLPAHIPGGSIRFGGAEAAALDRETVAVKVTGDDAEDVNELAERVRALLASLPNVLEAHSDRENAQEELQLHVDEVLAFKAGVTPSAIAQTVGFVLRGVELAPMINGGRQIPLWAGFESQRGRANVRLGNINVAGMTGKLSPLCQFTSIGYGRSPYDLRRENGRSVSYVYAQVNTANLSQVREGIDQVISSLTFPRGYKVEPGWQLLEMDNTRKTYANVLLLAVFLIYAVMAALFESMLLPLSILMAVPLALVGVYWTMYLSGTLMDTISYVGVIILAGVVVNNGIVIVDRINQLRLSGMDRMEAVVQAGFHRFRPVMMTTLTTIVGCLPLALGGFGGEAMRRDFGFIGHGVFESVGRVLVGGLACGTALTLLVVPLFYVILDDLQAFLRAMAGDYAGLIRRFRNRRHA